MNPPQQLSSVPIQEAHAELQSPAKLAVASPAVTKRPVVQGKFLFIDDHKFLIKGVTYGPFRPDESGNEYGSPKRVAMDCINIARAGVNTLRTYTVPPRWFLDEAQKHGLRVMIGLPWEQHITFLDDKHRTRQIENSIASSVKAIGDHPAVLAYSVGNEIPASIVRWHGHKRIEQFLHRLYKAVKQQDPNALVTYVNYPSTEYLDLPFLDFLSFNVFLESRDSLESYIPRLHNLAFDRPVLLTEIGLDSQRNGTEHQAMTLDWQVRTVFEQGCGGAFLFSWTDEWHRGGHDIEDWDFGITTRDRLPKPAYEAIRHAFEEVPFSEISELPRISVVVCTFNGAATIRDTLDALQKLDYSDYEIIVVNDGSTDNTATIAAEYDVRLVSTENRGLSAARNTGLEAATGSIVAYIDDDAYPDPDWLSYLALSFAKNDYVAVGGPNLPPPSSDFVADCVANSPGGPVHVLLTDNVAEHVPGCNMAIRKQSLESIGGFDPRFRAAGDDVDVCWRLQDTGGVIGYNAAAMVWHHRRGSLSTYWKQQVGYGRAEALLEQKWPSKYNSLGHTTWGGRIYGHGTKGHLATLRNRIYQGVWGSAPFQSRCQDTPGVVSSLSSTPEWYVLLIGLAITSLLGLIWSPLLITAPLCVAGVLISLGHAIAGASHARFVTNPTKWSDKLKLYSLTSYLHFIQPLARLRGRIRHGLVPWRGPNAENYFSGTRSTLSKWREKWTDGNDVLHKLQSHLQNLKVVVRSGNEYDSWDLEVRGGFFGRSRLQMAVEEHGGGKQMLRFRLRPVTSTYGLIVIAILFFLTFASLIDGAWIISVIFGIAVTVLLLKTRNEHVNAKNLFIGAILGLDT